VSNPTKTKKVIKPQPGPQTAFLNCNTDICVFGGAAGGSKTFSMLLLYYLHAKDDPLYRGVIFRRTIPMITNPGSLWDASKQLYLQLDPKIRFMEKNKQIIFPSGAMIQLSGMEREADMYNWQGAELTGIGFEEGTHFSESMITYLFSRMRSNSERNSYLRITCNPDANSFLRTWLVDAGYVDDETGYAIPSMSGKVKYFVRREGKMVWGLSPEDLVDKLNDPDIITDNEAMSFTFLASRLDDNPLMLKNNPRYKASLKGLTDGEKKALLEGNWNYTTGAKELFDRNWVQVKTNIPTDFKKIVRYWDRAGTKPNEGNRNPDWTVGTLLGMRMGEDKNPEYWVLDVDRFRDTPGEVKKRIIEKTKADKALYGMRYKVVLEQDPGQAGKSEASTLKKEIIEEANIHNVICRTASKAKKVRFRPFSTKAQEGRVYVRMAKWNDDFFNELEIFTGEPATTPKGAKDDQVDSSGGALNEVVGITSLSGVQMFALGNQRALLPKSARF